MKSNKNIQIKFTIDENTNIALRKLMDINHTTIQSIMEKLLKEYIFNSLSDIFKN